MAVEPPKDAEGREISLDTEILYDDGCSAHKDECAPGDILDRIHKLRGEGK